MMMLFAGEREGGGSVVCGCEREGSVVCGCEREGGVLFVGVRERGECCLWV